MNSSNTPHQELSNYFSCLLHEESHSEEADSEAVANESISNTSESVDNETELTDRDAKEDNNFQNDENSKIDKHSKDKDQLNCGNVNTHIPSVLNQPSAAVKNEALSTTKAKTKATTKAQTTNSLAEKAQVSAPCDLTKVEDIAHQLQQKRLQQLLQGVTVKPPETEVKTEVLTETSIRIDRDTVIDSCESIQGLEEQLASGNLSEQFQSFEFKPLSSEWLENGRPCWAQERFDILLVEVGGLKLAVPLESLGHIKEMDGDITPLFGQADWFMGIQKTAQGNIKTINTAKYVMPERYQEHHLDQLNYIISISGRSWGLAVDAIDQPISIDPDNIRWRANRSQRPWMAGTVKDHMCVLLDIPVLGENLSAQDANGSSKE